MVVLGSISSRWMDVLDLAESGMMASGRVRQLTFMYWSCSFPRYIPNFYHGRRKDRTGSSKCELDAVLSPALV